jgi:hypothetical protein
MPQEMVLSTWHLGVFVEVQEKIEPTLYVFEPACIHHLDIVGRMSI